MILMNKCRAALVDRCIVSARKLSYSRCHKMVLLLHPHCTEFNIRLIGIEFTKCAFRCSAPSDWKLVSFSVWLHVNRARLTSTHFRQRLSYDLTVLYKSVYYYHYYDKIKQHLYCAYNVLGYRCAWHIIIIIIIIL